jgi:hypothetical protein
MKKNFISNYLILLLKEKKLLKYKKKNTNYTWPYGNKKLVKKKSFKVFNLDTT